MDIQVELAPRVGMLRASSPSSDTPESLPTKAEQSSKDRGIIERATRIQNCLIEFFRLLATEDFPIALALDDLQWAGPASINLLDALMKDQQLKHLTFLCTCREEYLDDTDDENTQRNHQLVAFLEKQDKIADKMELSGLDMRSVQTLVADLLRMDESGAKVEELATIVHHKTNGNPFYVLQFVNLLLNEGLFTSTSPGGLWEWLVGDIRSQDVANIVSHSVQKRLQTLPSYVFVCLQAAACVDKTFEKQLLRFLLEGLSQVEYAPGDE